MTFLGNTEPYEVNLLVNGEDITKLLTQGEADTPVSEITDTTTSEFTDTPISEFTTTPVSEMTDTPISEILRSGYSQNEILSGQLEEVYATLVNSTKSLYLQLAKHTAELTNFSAEIDAFYNICGEQGQKLEGPEVGMPCAAKFRDEEGNEAWYRGQIVSVQGTSAQVLFVDYGNTESIVVDTMKEMLPAHLERPRYALHCSLSAELSAEVAKHFSDKVQGAEKLQVWSSHSFSLRVLSFVSPVKLLCK